MPLEPHQLEPYLAFPVFFSLTFSFSYLSSMLSGLPLSVPAPTDFITQLGICLVESGLDYLPASVAV